MCFWLRPAGVTTVGMCSRCTRGTGQAAIHRWCCIYNFAEYVTTLFSTHRKTKEWKKDPAVSLA
jgi:hypothetical protein